MGKLKVIAAIIVILCTIILTQPTASEASKKRGYFDSLMERLFHLEQLENSKNSEVVYSRNAKGSPAPVFLPNGETEGDFNGSAFNLNQTGISNPAVVGGPSNNDNQVEANNLQYKNNEGFEPALSVEIKDKLIEDLIASREKISALNSEISLLKNKDRSAQLSLERDQLLRRVAELEKSYQIRDQTIEKLKQDQLYSRKEIEEKNLTIEKIRGQYQDLVNKSKDRAILASDLKDKEDKLSLLKTQLDVITSEKEKLLKSNLEITAKISDITEKSLKLEKINEELKSRSELSAKDLKLVKDESKDLPQLKTQVADLTAKNQSLADELQKYKQSVESMPQLEKTIVDLRNEIALKNEEIKSLSSVNNSPQNPQLSGGATSTYPTNNSLPQNQLQNRVLNNFNRANPVKANTGQGSPQLGNPQLVGSQQPNPLMADVMVIEVIDEKINLRSGAGYDNSMVMQVQRGTRLTVESREGEWFRVLTPSGGRAYVHGSVVSMVGKNAPLAAKVREDLDINVPESVMVKGGKEQPAKGPNMQNAFDQNSTPPQDDEAAFNILNQLKQKK